MSDQLSPGPATLPSHLQAAVEVHLLAEGWKYEVALAPDGLSTQVRLWNKIITFTLEYSTHETRGRVLLQLVPAITMRRDRMAETALLLNWINAFLQCSAFHLVPGRNEFRLRIALAEDLGQPVDAEGVAKITSLALSVANGYCPIIREVAEGRATAEEMLSRIASPTR